MHDFPKNMLRVLAKSYLTTLVEVVPTRREDVRLHVVTPIVARQVISSLPWCCMHGCDHIS